MKEYFIDELLQEVEKREEAASESWADMMLRGIRTLQDQIQHNFNEAERECTFINDFTLRKNTTLQERIVRLENKLEQFIREKKEKTINLPNGVLKVRKMPDKVQVDDLKEFFSYAVSRPELVIVVPETQKPNLVAIKSHCKSHMSVPGVSVIPGTEDFKYTLNNINLEKESNYDGQTETDAGDSETAELREAV